jgi:uncharacterized protein (TIGR00369 family)
MSVDRPAKPISASSVQLSQLMQPDQANHHGNVHGGWIMKLVDEAGALACIRHSQQRVVTVAVDQMIFQHPIRIGDLVILKSEVSYVGTTSMEAEVNVFAENPRTGEQWHTNRAYLVYVAIDDNNKPTIVPGLIAENDEQAERMKMGVERQAYRKEQARRHAERIASYTTHVG